MPRPPKRRTVDALPQHDYFKPPGAPLSGLEEVRLSVDELEALRLKDKEGLNHEACAGRMQVSRPTFHRILASAHRKVAEALTEGKAIRIEGGRFRLRRSYLCSHCGQIVSGDGTGEADVLTCSSCGSEELVRPASGRRRRRRRRGGGSGGRG